MMKERLELTVGKKRMMFSTGLSAISNTRYLHRFKEEAVTLFTQGTRNTAVLTEMYEGN